MTMRFRLCLLVILSLMCSSAAAGAPRPGEAPPTQTLELRMNAGFVFPSPLASCVAGIENPENSGMLLRYRLTISAEELAIRAGIKLHSADPIVLYEGGPIGPGERIDSFKLEPLPGGVLLPQGNYTAVMTVIPTDLHGTMPLDSEFAMQLFVQVMVSQAEASADQEGLLDIAAYNGTDQPASYALIFRTEELCRKNDIDIKASGTDPGLIVLSLSGIIPPGQETALRLSHFPKEWVPEPGRYTAWLLRMDEEGNMPYVTTRLILEVPDGLKDLPVISSPFYSMDDIHQALVNAEYLLDERWEK